MNTTEKKSANVALSSRLSTYSIAAFAAVAAGSSADAALVSLPVNISSSDSFETFIDILPFATGAGSISVTTATNSFSGANPLAPNSELMLRGVSGIAGLRGNNGAAIAAFSSAGYNYVLGVGAPFVTPSLGAGSFLLGGVNGSLTYPLIGGGDFAPGTTNVAYFQFTNTATGMTHDGWATIFMGTASSGSLEPTITALHVDTGVIPSPGSFALLCMGATGIAGYRKRRA